MTAKTFSLSTGTVQGRRPAGRTSKARVALRIEPQGNLLRPGATTGPTQIHPGAGWALIAGNGVGCLLCCGSSGLDHGTFRMICPASSLRED